MQGEECKAGKIMDPFVDWGFKRLFGSEEHKDNLIGFLNLLLKPNPKIESISYINTEFIPDRQDQKRCYFDLVCENTDGTRFLVEMQKWSKSNFNERILYYTCSLITKMGKRGKDWDYADIKKVYSICLMNFKFGNKPSLRKDYAIYDAINKELFSDKLNIIMLQIPCLEAESISDCSEEYEFLLYLLNNMHKNMKTIEQLKKEVEQTNLPDDKKELFYKVLDTADVESLSEKERFQYEAELKYYRDTMNEYMWQRTEGRREGREEGRAEGRAEGRVEGRAEGRAEGRVEGIKEVAASLKQSGATVDYIAQVTKLPAEEIEKL